MNRWLVGQNGSFAASHRLTHLLVTSTTVLITLAGCTVVSSKSGDGEVIGGSPTVSGGTSAANGVGTGGGGGAPAVGNPAMGGTGGQAGNSGPAIGGGDGVVSFVGGGLGGGAAAGTGTPFGGRAGSGTGSSGGAGGGSGEFKAGFLFPDHSGNSSNARNPAIVIDSRGVVHALYSGFTSTASDVYPIRYGQCASNCGETAAWSWVTLADAGLFGGYGQLALGPDGHPHVAWLEQPLMNTLATLRYATCTANCTSGVGAWQLGTVVASPSPNVSVPTPLTGRSLTVDAQGRPRLALRREVYEPTGTFVAQCDTANCLSEASWRITQLNHQWTDSGVLVAVGSGLRLLSNPNATLTWQECTGGCTDAAAWTGTGLFDAPSKYLALALDSNAQPRVLFNVGNTGDAIQHNQSYYGWCNQGCTSSANWGSAMLPLEAGLGSDGLALVLDAQSGAPAAIYTTLAGLGASVCTANCNTPSAAWSSAEIETNDNITPAPLLPVCTGTAVPQAWWYPGRGVQAALDADGNLRAVHETYSLQKCGAGSVQETVRLMAYTQL